MRTRPFPSVSTALRRVARARRRVGVVAAVVAVFALVGPWAGFASADEIEELRAGVPTGEEVRSEIHELSVERDELLVALNAAETELIRTLEARDRFDDEQRRLAAQIEAAIEHLRTVAVQAFLTGGTTGQLDLLLSVRDVSDLAWRQSLLRNHAGSSHAAVERLAALEAQATDEVRASIDQAERLRNEIAAFQVEIDAIEPRLVELRDLEPIADAWDRAAIAIKEGRYGIAPLEKWEKMRFCESSDDYQAISPTGKYRGAYQFDLPTWQSVGGTGDPAAAPPAEQDARARELYARRGAQPWECGYWLE